MFRTIPRRMSIIFVDAIGHPPLSGTAIRRPAQWVTVCLSERESNEKVTLPLFPARTPAYTALNTDPARNPHVRAPFRSALGHGTRRVRDSVRSRRRPAGQCPG